MPLYNPSQGFANPMTTEGDLIVGGVAGVPTRLALGAATDVLTADALTAAWAAAAAGGLTVYYADMAAASVSGNDNYQTIVTIPNVPAGSYIAIGQAWLDDSNATNDISHFSISDTPNSVGTFADTLWRAGIPAGGGTAGADISPVIIANVVLAVLSDIYLTWMGISAIGGVPQIIKTTGAGAPTTNLTLLKYA